MSKITHIRRKFFGMISASQKVPALFPGLGESILYYHLQPGHWHEIRTNIFLAIYKLYLTNCRTRKILPNSTHFEAVLKYESKNIILTNPTNKDLVKNLLPLWTEHELSPI